MKKRDLDRFRKLLTLQREELLGNAKRTLSGDIHLDPDDFPDEIDTASSEINLAFTGRVREREQGLLKKVNEALERIEDGELPTFIPERPQGLERNIVATVRDWADEKAYLHDLSSTDRRDPTVNGYGKIYGSPELSTDNFPILDPVNNTTTTLSILLTKEIIILVEPRTCSPEK